MRRRGIRGGPDVCAARAVPASAQYGAGLLGVLASEAAWRAGGHWLDSLLTQLDEMRMLFGKLLGARLPRAGYIPPEAGYLAWVDCSRLSLGAGGAIVDRMAVAARS
jgi:bifunctional pyridoxal-dependent enzyme with beta-cystathionase and maltose regulon repressor activities